MDFELTDDDIREVWHKVDVQTMKKKGLPPLYIEYQYVHVKDEDRAIAKAAQRKLVLWLEKKHVRLYAYDDNVDKETEEREWKEVRKAVRL